MSFRFTRRGVLGAGMSLSVASALRSFRAEAADAAAIKRVVLFFTPHGTIYDKWKPTGSGASFQLSYILDPLKNFQSRLNVVDGLALRSEGPGAPHTRGPAVLFTGSPLADDGTFNRDDCSGGCTFGWNTNLSVDQEIVKRLGNVTPYGSLEFAVQSGGGFPGSHISYAGPAKPMIPRQDPYVAYSQLFANQTLPPSDRAKELARRLKVLDAVQGDLATLKPRVANADWTRLQSHADALSDLQRTLQATPPECTPPAAFEKKNSNDADYRPWALDRSSDLLAASLACGLTRVGSIMFRPGENDGGPLGIYSWLGQSIEHHLSTHDQGAEAVQRVADISRWYAERFAYLLQRLDSFPDGDGTLLDHTLVIWGSELGNPLTHDISNIPFVVAGGTKSGAKGGQYLKMSGTKTYANRLLVSALHYMGYSDVQKFGTVDDGSGSLPGILA